ncbi:MAG: gliding motility-associated C-terminal domain-containing protein [Paludibacteraceae bacterium]|nr:gliding motility-associated C-terminal domain-containing protein [Paludibacteraceae bacterium]
MKKYLFVCYLLSWLSCVNSATTVPLVKPCGLGTPKCPYRIGTPGELLYFAEVVNDLLDSIPHNNAACAVLTNDIDLSEVCGPGIGSWTSMGYYNCNYYGTFDGRNHRIENLYLDIEDDIIKEDELSPSAAKDRGFFGIVSEEGSVRNLTIGSGYLYAKLSNRGCLGAIAGNTSGKIYNCHNFATVEGDCYCVGGIVGLQSCSYGIVENCSNAGYVKGRSYAGGITGGFGCGETRNCYNIGTVEGNGYVGGIVGNPYKTIIENCYSFGKIIQNSKEAYSSTLHGGIVGGNRAMTLMNCYYNNSGTPTADDKNDFFYIKDEFKNGTIFHKLDSLYPGIWTQQVGVDSLPVFIEDNLLDQDAYLHKVTYICKGDSFEYNGKFYKETGIYHGECEDCMELYLKVLDKDTTNLSVVIEDGEYYKFGDNLLSESGVYTRVVENHYGCDSFISLNLMVLPPCKTIINEIFESICEGESYDFEGAYYNKTGKYVKRYVNSFGCDSIVTLNLNVLPKSVNTIKDTINQGYSYSKYNFSVSDQENVGVFRFRQRNINQYGCDSIVILKLTVLKNKEEISDTTLEIEDKPVVEPEDKPIVAPDTPEPPELVEQELEIPNIFTPYTEDGINDVFMEGYTVYIYDRYGNLVCHSNNGWDGKYRGTLADPGTYFYVVVLMNGKKEKGTIKVLKLK